MTRLSGYLIRLFAADAMALFAIAAFLLFLMQALRSFDVVSVKGQDLVTLLGQALLSMPTLAIAFLFVCIGIGLARSLKGLQLSQELHIIHSSRRTGALFGAIATYALGGALVVLLLTNIIEPTTKRFFNAWSAGIAADLVGRTLTPHRFVEVTPGVTLVIGSRGTEGVLGSFFADDRRNPEMRRTYTADSATVVADEEGYVLQLFNGAIQYMSDDFQFSEISFARYDLAVDRLTGATDTPGGLDTVTTLDLVQNALAAGYFDFGTLQQLGGRFGEGLRVLAICLMVAALAAFPHGRRNAYEVPIEIMVILAAFAERAVSVNVPLGTPLLPFSGPLFLGAASVLVLSWRMRPRRAALAVREATA
jgi:lipopolysaccharide export system permease protein